MLHFTTCSHFFGHPVYSNGLMGEDNNRIRDSNHCNRVRFHSLFSRSTWIMRRNL